MNIDFATITLVDHRGHTKLKFIKEHPDSGWLVMGKPVSRKTLRHNLTVRAGHQPAYRLIETPDGRQRIDLPGAPIGWDDNLFDVLDRLHAELGDVKISANHLRLALSSIV